MLQDWTRNCSFLDPKLRDPHSVVVIGNSSFHYNLTGLTLLDSMNLTAYKIYIDNTPFPYGIIGSNLYL